jgi:hypothetical protein
VTGQRSNQLNYDPNNEVEKFKASKWRSKFGELTQVLSPSLLLFYFSTFFRVGGTGFEPVTAGV